MTNQPFNEKKLRGFQAENAGKKIAIIGMSCKLPKESNIDEYWELLLSGADCIVEFPTGRKDKNKSYLKALNLEENEYLKGGFLDNIDYFDYNFFSISPKEASLMSPEQRMLMETVWNASENAGYGGNKLSGSRTGVYIGYGNEVNTDYKQFVSTLAPNLSEISVTGNTKSIIAGRISYMLNLKGPSLLVDTACSSSLVAIHLACKAILNHECDLAIAGSVKLNILPIKNKHRGVIGIESSDYRAKAFDDTSDGTGYGEGVAAIILKPLEKAIEDGDSIYATIIGSAMNQDGTSISMSAPNPMSQAEVIRSAWQDAGVNPETISYIEAHGTGTKLGDPIEINGINAAFSSYTDKKQFCAIGSVKSNIGHLGCASAMAGLIKAVLSLHHKKIPPSIHFNVPNRRINFVESPVFVNDKVNEWSAENSCRRCGISSFGISGTNCHMILEEAPKTYDKSTGNTSSSKRNIITISAKSEEGIYELLKAYQRMLSYRDNPININDFCYTANTARGHYNYRLAFTVTGLDDLNSKVSEALCVNLEDIREGVFYYGKHKVANKQKSEQRGVITLLKKNQLSQLSELTINKIRTSVAVENVALYDDICRLYIQGADIPWNQLYDGSRYKRIRIPVYPFAQSSCWIESNESGTLLPKKNKQFLHKLVSQRLIDNYERMIFKKVFQYEEDWVVNQHRVLVNGNSIVVGTAFLEICRFICEQYSGSKEITLSHLTFINPLVVNTGKCIDVQIILKKDIFKLEIISQNEDGLCIKHVEGSFSYENEVTNRPALNIDTLRKKLLADNCSVNANLLDNNTRFGKTRWDCIEHVYLTENTCLVHIKLGDDYCEELDQFGIHPAMMDIAANIMIFTKTFDAIYLPFYYKKFKYYSQMPREFYSILTIKELRQEMVSFEIQMTDLDGNVFIEIEEYIIKKIT